MRYDNTKLCLFSAPGGDERTHRQLQGETDHFHHLGDKRAIGYQSVREGKKKKKLPDDESKNRFREPPFPGRDCRVRSTGTTLAT